MAPPSLSIRLIAPEPVQASARIAVPLMWEFNPSRAKRVLEDARHSMKYTRLPVFDSVPQYFKLGDRFEVLRAAGGALGGDQVYQR